MGFPVPGRRGRRGARLVAHAVPLIEEVLVAMRTDLASLLALAVGAWAGYMLVSNYRRTGRVLG